MKTQNSKLEVILEGIHYLTSSKTAMISVCKPQTERYRPYIFLLCQAPPRPRSIATFCGEAKDPWKVDRPDAPSRFSIDRTSLLHLFIITLALICRLSVSTKPAKYTDHGELQRPGREPGLYRVHGCDYWRWHFWFVDPISRSMLE